LYLSAFGCPIGRSIFFIIYASSNLVGLKIFLFGSGSVIPIESDLLFAFDLNHFRIVNNDLDRSISDIFDRKEDFAIDPFLSRSL